MKIFFAAEGHVTEKSVLVFGLDLSCRLGGQLSVVHVCDEGSDTDKKKKDISNLLSEYPNLKYDPLVLDSIIAKEGDVSPMLIEMMNEHKAELIILAKRHEGSSMDKHNESLIGSLLRSMNISIMAVPLKGLGSVERILLTTKSPRIQHCTPEGLIPFIKAYGAHLSTIHVTESGVAYKALIDDKGQNPGWLFEVMDDKGSQEIVEILEHIVEEGQADMIVFEIMDGEHILTESKEFKKFYDNCPIPILFIPV